MFFDYSQHTFNPMPITCFKPYDIRGKLETQLTNEVAYRIGRAYGQLLQPKSVVVGSDVRLTSETLKQHLTQGLMDAGVNVVDIGLAGTEEVYFAAFHLDVQGGVEVTASHNPMDYNGMKLVAEGAKPISSDTGLNDIQAIAEAGGFSEVAQKGSYSQVSILDAYIEHLLGYVQLNTLKPMRLVVNAGNGVAGHVIDALELAFAKLQVPVEFIKIHHEADGTFPNGIPNPILLENQPATANAVIAHKADMGIAWDGDFDRCFLFDEKGGFVEGYYIVGLLAEAFLQKNAGAKVIHDPRLTWNTIELCEQNGGQAIQSKTGHAFIKERMRAENAVYGGEMSAHHYFKDFAYCDSGMIPWLLVIDLLSRKNTSLSALLTQRQAKFPCSGEVNFTVADSQASIAVIKAAFADQNPLIDTTDGLSMEFATWRMNIRASNTEPLLRLNIESRADAQLVADKLAFVTALIQP